MALLLYRLGSFSYRHRLGVLVIWLVVLVGGGIGAVTLSGETSNAFSIPGQESTTALERIGTADAKKELERLAGGVPEARLTRDAAASLGRSEGR